MDASLPGKYLGVTGMTSARRDQDSVSKYAEVAMDMLERCACDDSAKARESCLGTGVS